MIPKYKPKLIRVEEIVTCKKKEGKIIKTTVRERPGIPNKDKTGWIKKPVRLYRQVWEEV